MHQPDLPSKDAASSRYLRRRAAIIVAIAVGLIALAVTAWTLPPEVWPLLHSRAEAVAAWVRALGPLWFFSAFALLTAFGVPVTFFALSAGPLYAPALGMPAVLGLAAACMAASMTLTYLLARYALRPWVSRCLAYLGYAIPEISPQRRRWFVFLVRVTPGPPYVLQSALLGMANVPFRLYFPISFLVCTVNVMMLIVFGAALAKGSFYLAAGVAVALAVAALIIRTLRQRARS